MHAGLLEMQGTLDVSQFWPSGESDADTVKMLVKPTSFRFSPDGKEAGLKETSVFDGAKVHGKSVINNKGNVTIRLQGIDAPELHFAATIKKKGLIDNGTRFRQYWGETSTVALGSFLRAKMRGNRCRILTRVDSPNDVFDTYGRFIGDVLVKTSAGEVDINHWLVEKGWAFPTYYNSMRPEEVTTIQALATKAKKAGLGIWSRFTLNTAAVDYQLHYRKGGPAQPAKDVGPCMMPKLFRRRIRYYVSRRNNLIPAGKHFAAFLSEQKDGWSERRAFLASPTMTRAPRDQGNLGVLVDDHDTFAFEPGDLLFFESAATLVGKSGRPVTRW